MTDEASGMTWVKSSYSSGAGGECVEIAETLTTIRIRDSKRAHGPVLSVGSEQWAVFVRMAARC
jgi:hypothetical protein